MASRAGRGYVSVLPPPRVCCLVTVAPCKEDSQLHPRPASRANQPPGGPLRTLVRGAQGPAHPRPGGEASQLGAESGAGHPQGASVLPPTQAAPGCPQPCPLQWGPSPLAAHPVWTSATSPTAQRCCQLPHHFCLGREGGKQPTSCPLSPQRPQQPCRALPNPPTLERICVPDK